MLQKKILVVFAFFIFTKLLAQQKINLNQLNFVYTNKPNTIIYHDTVYKGSAEFKQLFFRQVDKDLWKLYYKHQDNKVWGNVLNAVGIMATTYGVIVLSSNASDKNSGWIWIGGGIATTAVGSYLMLQGQKNLLKAITLFNRRYAPSPALGIGVGNQQIGLVYKF
jgi:hypothetical protein